MIVLCRDIFSVHFAPSTTGTTLCIHVYNVSTCHEYQCNNYVLLPEVILLVQTYVGLIAWTDKFNGYCIFARINQVKSHFDTYATTAK